MVTPHELVAIPVRKIDEEIKNLCHLDQDSVLRDSDKALHTFSWEVVWRELESKVPTLLQLYKQLFPRASQVLICFAISLVIKCRSPKMSLIQRVVSTFLYGNGASKQVGMNDHTMQHACIILTLLLLKIYNCLQPFMVCLSYNGTIKQMRRLTEDFDVDVTSWSKTVKINRMVL